MPETEKEGISVRFPPKAVIIRILIFTCIIVGTLLVLRPLQLTLQNRMERARDTFISQAEEFLGVRILYGSTSPSIFGVFDIRNLSIIREDESVLLSVSRARLYYSIFELLWGENRDLFRSMRFDHPVLSLDFQKDASLIERFRYLQGNGDDRGEIEEIHIRNLLPDHFTFRIWNGEWAILDSAGGIRLTDLGIEASVLKDNISFNGRWNARLSASALDAVMSGYIRGDYFGNNDSGNAIIALDSIVGNNFSVNPLTFSFFLTERQLEIRKTHDRSPIDILMIYDRENSKFQGHFEGENFSLENLATFTGAWRDFNTLLALQISGSAGVLRDNSDGFVFNMDFSGIGLENSVMQQAFLDLSILGNSDNLIINTFNYSSPFGQLEFRGGIDFNPNTPYGSLSLSNFRLFGDRGISGVFLLDSNNRETRLTGQNLRTGDLSLPLFELSISPIARGLGFILSTEDAAGGSLLVDAVLDTGSTLSQASLFNANFRLDSFSIGNILSFSEPLVSIPISSPLRAFAENIVVSTEAFFNTNNGDIFYEVPNFTATSRGFMDLETSASFSGTNHNIDLNLARISWEGSTLEASGDLDISDLNEITFSLDTRFNNLAYSFEGLVIDGQSVAIRGSHGFQVMLSQSDLGGFTGYIRGDAIPVQDGPRPATASFYAGLFFDSPSYWRASIDRFEITGLSTPLTSSGTVRFTGTANERGMNIPDLFFDDGQGALQGNFILDWAQDFQSNNFRLAISGRNGNETYHLSGSIENNKLDLDFSGNGMQLSRFTDQNAIIDGDFKLSWESPESFELNAELASLVLHRQGGAIRASAFANMDSQTLLAEKLVISRSGIEFSIPYIKIDRNTSLIETEALIWGALSGKPMDILLRAEANFNSSDSWADLLLNLAHLDGSVLVGSARYGDIENTEPFIFTFNTHRQDHGLAFSLNGGPRNMLRFRYVPDNTGGSFFAAFSAPSPVRGTFSGQIASNMIDAQTTDLYVDMGYLWRFLPPEVDEVIVFPGGIATGSIRMTGPLSDPEFYGIVHGRSLQIIIPEFITTPIRPVPVAIVLNGHDMNFGPIEATVGQGFGLASGWFRFDQWIPNIFTIDIQVPHENPIPYDFNISGVLARGLTSGKLTLSMEDLIFSVTGDLMAHDTVMSMNANELAALLEFGASNLSDKVVHVTSDINIQTGRRAEFIWPLEFPIIQANADMGTTIHIASDDIAGRYSLTGDVRIRSGEIFYLERNFYIREGTLAFRENEIQFDPRISARAELREQSDIGPVIISMIIDNAPLMSFTPRFTSNPPLPQVEIYALLGHIPLEGNTDGSRNLAASAVIDGLAQVIVVQRLQRQVRDFLGLDMFSVRTQILQNALLHATGDGGERSIVDNTTIFLGRYFGAEIFGEAMLSFRQDDEILGGGIRLEPEFGLEMRNPFFDIRISMIPNNPDSMFLDDVSLSLIWRRSY